MQSALARSARTVDTLGDIISMWGPEQKGALLLDEVDMLLHPLRSELNFPLGSTVPLDLGPVRHRLAMHVIELMLAASSAQAASTSSIDNATPGFTCDAKALGVVERMTAAVAEGYASMSVLLLPHLVLVQQSYYHEALAPIVADWVVLWFRQQLSSLRSGR